MVGLFGAVVFDAASFLAKDMKREASSEWAEHKILGNIPTLERTGGECSTFSCALTFNRRHTLPLEIGMALLESYAKSGQFFPLIIGLQLVGGFSAPNFVLTKVESQYGIVDKRGRGLHSTLQCEFKQYRVASGSGMFSASGFGGLGSALGQIASAVSGVPVIGTSVIPSLSSTLTAAGGVVGAVSNIPNMIGSVAGKAIASIPTATGGTGTMIPGAVRIG